MISSIGRGIGLLIRGLGIVLSKPKLFALGMVPPLITSVVMLAALVALLLNIDQIVAAMTGFTESWGTAGSIVRVVIGIVLVVAAVLVMVLTFTAITLALGDPIYQQISRRVDAGLGPLPPEAGEKTSAMVNRTVRQVAATIGMSALGALICFLIGLVPAVGAVLAAIASALIGGRLMVREITGPAFERRGLLETAARRPVLQGNRALTMGFGVPTFWLLSIPGVAVIVFPAAVAGATLLVRRMLDEPIDSGSSNP